MAGTIDLKHADLTQRLIGLFYEVYTELGHGFLESVYEEAFAIALLGSGLSFTRQVPLFVWFRGLMIGNFRADFVIDEKVLIELKAVKALGPPHEAQLINYLKATEIEVGLILNFGPRPTFLRRVFEDKRKTYRR